MFVAGGECAERKYPNQKSATVLISEGGKQLGLKNSGFYCSEWNYSLQCDKEHYLSIPKHDNI